MPARRATEGRLVCVSIIFSAPSRAIPKRSRSIQNRAGAYDIGRAAFGNLGERIAAVCGVRTAVDLDAALALCGDIKGNTLSLGLHSCERPGMCQTVPWLQWRVSGGFRRMRA